MPAPRPRPALALLAAFALLAGAASCRIATRDEPAPGRSESATPVEPGEAPWAPRGRVAAPTPAPTAPAPRQRPTLDREPIVNVLLAEGSRVRFTLSGGGQAVVAGARVPLSGEVVAEAAGDGVRLGAGGGVAQEIVVQGASGFSAQLDPPFGAPQRLSFSGAPVIAYDRATHLALLIERVPLERYLAGVVPTEMSPSYPYEALAAQAIAARSYACARFLERWDQPWQLHWHYSVDMAYGGAGAHSSDAARRAVEDTRGVVLTYRGQPVPALFHASSGGRTEDAGDVFPLLRFPDGSPAGAAMPSIDDAACEGGARALKLTTTHWRWKATIPLAAVTRGLHEWTREKPAERPSFGTVESIKVLARSPRSNRVERVSVRHRVGRRLVETELAGHDLRMAIGPGIVRSTAWDRCVIAREKGGALVLEGRGFGHGVGLSQISAWQMAKSGQGHDAILARFYPSSAPTKRW